MADARERFDTDGYITVPRVLSAEQVADLRGFCEGVFSRRPSHPGDIENIRGDIFCRYPPIRWLLAHPPLVAKLRDVLGGDFVFLPDMAIHDSYFGKKWHKDTTNIEAAGFTFQAAPDFRMAIVAIYLQDNGEYGGGLNVVPGSHRRKDEFVRFHPKTKWSIWRKIRARLAGYGVVPHERNPVVTGDGPSLTLATGAGDAVIFDFRMSHKATAATKTPIPASHRKFAFFLSASANDAHVPEYMEFLKQDDGLLAYVRGHTYEPEVVELARRNDLRLA